jgi:hypothetical protein
LRSLRAEQPGSLEVYARLADGTEVSRAMRPFTATASNAVLWGRVADIEAMGELSTVFVTPNDPAVAGLRPAVEARSIFPGGFGGGAPYERANYLRNDTLSGGFYLSEFFYLRRGSRVSWQLQSVTGSGSPAVDVYAFTIDQFVAWRDSGGTMAVSVARDQRTGATGSFVAPSDNGYVFVLFNRSGSPSRTVVWTRSNTGYDVARDALSAIFLELRARGMRYTNLATSYFVGWQNVRRPAESLAMRTANCIDGTFLFASILESAGMRPYIVLVPGHAFVAVAMGPDPDDPLMPIETTMVGSAATADEAIWCALGDCPGNRAMPRFDIDVTAARRAGIRPIPTL